MANASTIRAGAEGPAQAGQYESTRIEGGITAPLGFTSAALHCGIKAKAGVLDLTVVSAAQPVAAAGLFTLNLAQAAPVLISKRNLFQFFFFARAIVINSGCANACTGTQGYADAETMAREVASALGCSPEDILVASTGVIGVNLNMGKVTPGIRTAVSQLSRGKGADVARAIMTTDPFPKEDAVRVETAAGTFSIGGTAKGSGMIEPNMATMIGMLTTDAQVSPALLRRALECLLYTSDAAD